MLLVVFQSIVQTVSSTLHWFGFYVLIPVYAVPRAFLIHSYSLIGLITKTSQQPRRTESLHYGAEAAAA